MALKESIKVTVGQAKHDGEFENLFDQDKRLKYKEPTEQLDILFRFVETAKQGNADFLVLPELFLPRTYLHRHVKAICEKHQLILIGGLEYGPGNIPENDRQIPLTNCAFVALPSTLQKRKGHDSRLEATIIEIPKILPAPDEKEYIENCGYTFNEGNRIYVFDSETLGKWAVLICVDFLNLPLQVLLQGNIQTLFIVAYNKDVQYYVSLADTMHRLLLCNVIICNTGYYGRSLCFTPYRSSHKRDAFQVIGNQIDAAVTVELPLRVIREAQKTDATSIKYRGLELIKRPPDYGKMKIRSSFDS